MDDEFASPIDITSSSVPQDDGFMSSVAKNDDGNPFGIGDEDNGNPFGQAEAPAKDNIEEEEREVEQEEEEEVVEETNEQEEEEEEVPLDHENKVEEPQEEKKPERIAEVAKIHEETQPKQEPKVEEKAQVEKVESPATTTTTATTTPTTSTSPAPVQQTTLASSPPPSPSTSTAGEASSSKPKTKKPKSPQAKVVPGSKAPKWVPDSSSSTCTDCKKPFTFLNRRHHCRRCGGLFCSDCCGLNVSLPVDYGYKTRTKVCSGCFHKTLKERITIPSFSTIPDGGPSTQTKAVSSMAKMFYWKMGAYDGATFDRSIVDSVENSSAIIPVQQVQDLMIDRDNAPTFRLRIYTPEKQGKLPILMWYHTGHFCTRNIESPSVDGLCRLLANHIECIVISVDYRLAPENHWPCAVEDCYAALEWALGNSNNLRGDTTRIAVGGDGAGGNLAAAVALRVRDTGLVPLAHMRCQIIVSAPLDLTPNATSKYNSRTLLKDAYVVPTAQWKWFVSQYIGQQSGESPLASPLLAESFESLPPALVITAGHDPFFSEGELFADKLRKAGISNVIYTMYTNSIHGFFGSGLDESDEAIMEVVLYVSARFK